MIGEEVDQEVAPQPKAAKEPETVTLSKADHAALIRERDELRVSERSWADRAMRGQPKTAPEPEEEEPIDTDGIVPEVTGNAEIDEAIWNDPERWTDEITKGPKAIGQYIKSLGLVSAKEAAEIAVKAARQEVKHTVRNLQTDQKLVGDFKDMQDANSELFKAAAPIYQELVRMNGGKQATALLYAAAKAAKAELAGKAAPAKKRPAEDDYERYEPEEDRSARARAQGSDRGRSAPVADDEDGDLGPEALAICKAMDITPAAYVASQKQLGTRRRR